MKLAPACKNCPWRSSSNYDYDDDGRDAFASGYDASCHALVGLHKVFHHQPARDGEECRGPANLDAGRRGYRNPVTAPAG